MTRVEAANGFQIESFFFFFSLFVPEFWAEPLLRCLGFRGALNALFLSLSLSRALLLSSVARASRLFFPASLPRAMATTSIASRRLQSELREWQTNPPEGCCLCAEPESLTSWTIIMTPPDCARIYENEVFR